MELPARSRCRSRPPLLLLSIALSLPSLADDWPQWRGPNRDGVWAETGVVDRIPDSGLKLIWRARIGRGYSGPVVADGRVYVTDRWLEPESERVLCFDESTGARLWDHAYPVAYENMEYGNGPRASPLARDGLVYTLGTQGRLLCLDAATGRLVWQKDLVTDYGAAVPHYGMSAAPIVHDELLIVCVGGKPNAGVVAFDRRTGAERWRALDDRPAYSAPIIVHRGGADQLIHWSADGVTSLDPAVGAVHWRIAWRSEFDAAEVVSSPVVRGDRLLLVKAWSRGSRMVRFDPDEPRVSEIWQSRAEPTTTMATSLWIDDERFCTIANGFGLTCYLADTGDEVWHTDEVAGTGTLGHAHLTANGDNTFLFNQRGQLITAKLTSRGYRETGRTLLIEPTAGFRAQGPVAWAHPAYANRHVIARNDRELVRASLDASDYADAPTPVARKQPASRSIDRFLGANAAQALSITPDGGTLAIVDWMGNLHLASVATGDDIPVEAPGIRNRGCAIAIAPDGSLVAYVGGSEFEQASNNRQTSGRVLVWDLAAGTARAGFEGHTNQVLATAFSPDGGELATAGADRTIRLWDPATGALVRTLEGHTDAVSALAWLPDGGTLVSASWDRTVRLWDATTGDPIATIDGHDEEILSIAVSPDGATLATGSADWKIRLVDLATREPRGELAGHQGGVYCLAFSPDGDFLASGSGDETVRLWHTRDGRATDVLRGHASGVIALAFSPDGQTLATAGRDDAVRLWSMDPGR